MPAVQKERWSWKVASKKSKKAKKSSEPKSMGALLDQYGGKIKSFSRGERVKGKVVDKRKNALVLDIGGKSEGLVAEKAFNEAKDFIEKLKEGDEVTAKVIVPETKEGHILLSLREAANDAAWEKMRKAKKKASPVEVTAVGTNPAGILVDSEGVTGFVPRSQLGKKISKKVDSLEGKSFEVAVLEVDRDENRLVFSERAISEKEDIELMSKALKKIKEGEVFKGRATTVANFGAFVEIEVEVDKKKVPVEGLVHISELSWDKVDKTEDVVSVGDKVEVKAIGVDDGKLALSIKQAEKDPWEEAEKKYKPDTKVSGKVVKTSDFGAFVQIEPGVEGLIHITKIPPDKKYKKGDEIEAYVEEVDKEGRKISLRPMLTAKPVGYK